MTGCLKADRSNRLRATHVHIRFWPRAADLRRCIKSALGYTGRGANPFGKAALDPTETSASISCCASEAASRPYPSSVAHGIVFAADSHRPVPIEAI